QLRYAPPPLGVGGGAYRSWVFETKEFDIPDRSRLAFYTDGMVEDKGRDIDEGIGVMAALLANCPPDSLEECCDAVTDVLGITGDTSDDATLLLAQNSAHVTVVPGAVYCLRVAHSAFNPGRQYAVVRVLSQGRDATNFPYIRIQATVWPDQE
ncbi:SpoIIE family protein phosphatase, partial [Catenulispora sp. NF23]|uniref:SpoIIE family protein phosphatase n=1 Tax=Catenulispora pinistramenti TaxID=2705254 RepID=UPI001BA49D18